MSVCVYLHDIFDCLSREMGISDHLSNSESSQEPSYLSQIYRFSLHLTENTDGVASLNFDMTYIGTIFIFYDIYIYFKNW